MDTAFSRGTNATCFTLTGQQRAKKVLSCIANSHIYAPPAEEVSMMKNTCICITEDRVQLSDIQGIAMLFGYIATGYDLGFQFTNGLLSSGNFTTATNTITTNIGYAMSSNERGGFQRYLENGMLSGGQVADTGQEIDSQFAQRLARLL